MSAFMVADETINRIVTWLAREVSTHHVLAERLAKDCAIAVGSDKWEEKLAQAMFQLNCDGVNARYGEGEAEQFRPLHFTYKTEPYTSLIQVLKSLQCWMYQCCEGNVPQTNLYKYFEEVEKHLALKIVRGLPEYNKVTWG
jgi:hypothetical protein